MQSQEALTRSLAANGFIIIESATPVAGRFAGFQVIQDATVKGKATKKGSVEKLPHIHERSTDLATTGIYATGAEFTFLAGYIDLGFYEELTVATGVVKAFFG